MEPIELILPATATDTELIERFKQPENKEQAFTLIIKKYQEKIYWHIRRLVVSHYDTDDILQNVFIKIWRSLDNFRGDSQLYTWLYRIATNESLSFLEQQKKQSTVDFDTVTTTLENKIKTSENYSAEKIEWKLQLALQQLPQKQRVVFCLRYYEEMKYEEMSKILNTTEGALKASYHHAAKKVEEYILNN